MNGSRRPPESYPVGSSPTREPTGITVAGGSVVSMEGEDSGDWVLVDCGDAVVHILQPAIRDYYNLEEIWGGKSVRLKSAAHASIASKTTGRKAPARRAR